MNLIDFKDLIILVSALVGSFGWIVALFRFNSENKRDQALATKSIQEANDLLLNQYREILDIKNNEIKKLKEQIIALTEELELTVFEMVQKDQTIKELEIKIDKWKKN